MGCQSAMGGPEDGSITDDMIYMRRHLIYKIPNTCWDDVDHPKKKSSQLENPNGPSRPQQQEGRLEILRPNAHLPPRCLSLSTMQACCRRVTSSKLPITPPMCSVTTTPLIMTTHRVQRAAATALHARHHHRPCSRRSNAHCQHTTSSTPPQTSYQQCQPPSTSSTNRVWLPRRLPPTNAA